MIVPDEVRKCVVFVGEEKKTGGRRACGTAFIVARPIEGTDRVATYCVTAWHTIKRIMENGGYKVLLRLNLVGGGARWIETEVHDWKTHPDDSSVDVAVLWLDWLDLIKEYDFVACKLSMALDEQIINDLAIGIGDELFFVGLFSEHQDTHKNIPIVRVGNIAAMPEEMIRSQEWCMHAYLVEARSIGGLSGSPAFVHVGTDPRFRVRRTSKPQQPQSALVPAPTFYLLGLVHGHWDAKDSVDATDEDSSRGNESVNMGIAIVVPMQTIMYVIDQDEFKRKENKMMQEWNLKHSPTPDDLHE
jgi:hypothetical protein